MYGTVVERNQQSQSGPLPPTHQHTCGAVRTRAHLSFRTLLAAFASIIAIIIQPNKIRLPSVEAPAQALPRGPRYLELGPRGRIQGPQQLRFLVAVEGKNYKMHLVEKNQMTINCLNQQQPTNSENFALSQNGHWKPELLRERDGQQLWFFAGTGRKCSETLQEGEIQCA